MLWVTIGQALADGTDDLIGLWADKDVVHMAIRPAPPKTPCVISTALRNGEFPSIGRFHPPAIRLERAIRDLYGFAPFAAQDKRPWLDHGAWGFRAPLGARFPTPMRDPAAYEFLPVQRRGPAPNSGRPGSRRHHRARAISASPRTARPWRGSRSGSATCTRASMR